MQLIDCRGDTSPPLHTLTALFNLGLLYQSGAEDLPASASEAVQWWGEAAALNFPPAVYNLAVLHLEGTGVPKGRPAA